MDASFTELLLHTEVRWLSRGKVPIRIFLFRQELEAFLQRNMTNELVNFMTIFAWQTSVGCMASIFEHLNKLNLNYLQGKKIDIVESI